MKYMTVIRAINGVTATTVSAAINAENAERISIIGKRSDHSSGATVFTVDISHDGTTWTAYNKLIDNVTNTNGQTLTRVASKSLGSNTTCLLTMSPEDTYKFIRVTATETTDGTHDAWVMIQYS